MRSMPKTRTILAGLALLAIAGPAAAQTWTTFGTEISNRIRSVHIDGDDIYVGGDFATVTGDDAMSRIARWDGTQWHPVGQGVDNRVYGIAALGSNIYVTGRLTEAFNSDGSSVSVSGAAMWDGSEWHALGAGLEGPSSTLGFAIAAGGGKVYIGGDLTAAGGSAVSNIAAWDEAAQAWEAVGAGFMDVVRTLAFDSATETLYAGGSFDVATDMDQFNFIAAWDGFRWNELGDGLSDTGRTIAISDSYVYVGGGSGTQPVLARWDGTAWENMNEGLDDRVDALLAVSDDVVYASGDFLNIGGAAAERLAILDNGTWSAVGAGLDDKAISMKVQGNDVVIGGEFDTANGDSSASLVIYTPMAATSAQSDEVPDSFELGQNYPNPFNPSTAIEYTLSEAGEVTLMVFDMLGREVATLVRGLQPAGSYTMHFNAEGFPSGAYLYTLRHGSQDQTRIMLLAR